MFLPSAENYGPARQPTLATLGSVTPTYKMPDEDARRRQAAFAEVNDALCAARCAAQLAGLESEAFVVRELLLTVIQQIDRAAVVARRLR